MGENCYQNNEQILRKSFCISISLTEFYDMSLLLVSELSVTFIEGIPFLEKDQFFTSRKIFCLLCFKLKRSVFEY